MFHVHTKFARYRLAMQSLNNGSVAVSEAALFESFICIMDEFVNAPKIYQDIIFDISCKSFIRLGISEWASNSQTDKPDFPQKVRLLHVFTFVVLSHYTPK